MAEGDLVLGIDQSTQGTKALLFDDRGNLIEKETLPHRQIINEKGYVEHDLNEIYKNVIELIRMLTAKDPSYDRRLKTVGLSVQRETVGAWNKTTLEPLYNAIVWQCARGAAYVNQPQVKERAADVRRITGLEMSEYFSAAKITWLLDNVPAVKACAADNNLCVGNMDTFLIHKLTHGQSFKTEPSDASRTQLLDIRALEWSEEMCALFKVPLNALPEITDSDAVFGETDFEGALSHKIPIHAAMGDSMCALFGHGCLNPGEVKTTYGTGSSIMMNSGDTVTDLPHGIVTSVGWRRGGKTTYVLEGNINYSAGIISYLKDDLKLISDAGETEALAKSANPEDKCYFVPALSGLGAPYFTADVRGTIVGMSRLTGKNELVRAALDSIAFQVTDILELINKSAPVPIKQLCGDGGATRNGYLMQLQSDLTRIPIKVPSNSELSGTGAAYMAGIAAGIYTEEILKREDAGVKDYRPQADESLAKTKLMRWHKAVKTALGYGV